MVKIAIVQGRLSSPVGTRYQYFPIHAWREEFATAAEMGFDGIEWIVSDFSNPLFDPTQLDVIRKIIEITEVHITSLSLDVLMYHPLFDIDWDDISWLFKKICLAVSALNIRRISIPIEENSGIQNPDQAKQVQSRLAKILNLYGHAIPLTSIETDLSVHNLNYLLSLPEMERLGVLVDTGNAAANGYNIEDYFSLCGSRIYGFHIKERGAFFQPTESLGKGDAEIKYVLENWQNLPQLHDITLQTYRTPDGFIDDAKCALNHIRKHMVK